MPSRAMRTLSLALAMTLLLFAGLPRSARADSQQCSLSNTPWVNCLSTYGNGLTVERFRIERQNGAIIDTICDFGGYVTVVHDNQLLGTFVTDFVHGCRYQVAWIDKDIGITFPEDSIACEYFYVNTNVLTSGQPCAHIHS